VRAWFYDTWGFQALSNRGDQDHGPAREADGWRRDHGTLVVTTDFVLDETLTGLHRSAGATTAIRFLDLLESRIAAGQLTMVEVTSSRRATALVYFRRLAPDVPRLSFTDCTSFAVMEELGIEIAFTADRDFHRPGSGIRPLFELVRGRLTWTPPTG
jgi:predicted nucleic acid-binding protein